MSEPNDPPNETPPAADPVPPRMPEAPPRATAADGPPYGPPPGYYPPPWAWGPPPPPPPAKKKRSWMGMLFIVLVAGTLLVLIATSITHKLQGQQGSGLGFGKQIGLVRIQGVLMQNEAKDFWMDSLERLGEDKSIRGVIVRIESPGGAVGASQELQAALERLSTRHGKKVFVSMGDTAASGGYYIASAAERIFALKGTLTGSIGVIMSLPKVYELADKVGYKTEVIKSGRFKDAWSSMRPSTDIERQMMNGLIRNAYDQFIDDIIKHRDAALVAAAGNLPAQAWTDYLFEKPATLDAVSYLHQVADGRVYSGEQALELGLVDQLGTLDDTIEAMGKTLGIEGKPELLEYEPRKGLLEMLNSKVEMIMPSTHASLQYFMMLE